MLQAQAVKQLVTHQIHYKERSGKIMKPFTLLAVLGLIVLVIRQLYPDYQRYMRIRHM